jgi:hypothetical protein
MTINSPLPPGPLTSSPPAALILLTRQSVTPLSRTAFVKQCVKEWVLLREAIARHRSYPGRPTRLKPALGK